MIGKNIKRFFRPLQNEEGSVIVVVLFILVIVTLIGISDTSNTVVELQIASNDQLQKIAFYNADSGIYGTPKLISNAVNTMLDPPVATDTGSIAPGIEYLPDDGSYVANTFYRQIVGFDAYDGGTNDISFAPGGIAVDVDVERRRQRNLVGSGTEFASGSEGMGSGSVGGVAIFYGMNANGTGPRNSASNLTAEYRKVIGVPGGL
jgi:hypothetical protein